MGILASHVPSIEQLRPGVIEVIEGAATKKFFGNYPILDGTKDTRQDIEIEGMDQQQQKDRSGLIHRVSAHSEALICL